MFSLGSSTNVANDGGVISASAGSSVRMSTSGSAGALSEQMVTAKCAAGTSRALSRPLRLRLESRRRRHRAQQQHVVDVDHRGVGGSGMRLPDRPAVERLEGLTATLHVWEAPHPHEALRAIQITELSDQFHSDGFLRLDELAVEEFDQHVSLAVPERVLAKLDHGAAGGHHAVSSSPGPRHRIRCGPTRVSDGVSYVPPAGSMNRPGLMEAPCPTCVLQCATRSALKRFGRRPFAASGTRSGADPL